MILDKILDAISKIHLFEVHIHNPTVGGTHIKADSIQVGDSTVHADKCKNDLRSMEGTLPLSISDPQMGPLRPQIGNVILEGLPESARERTVSLDVQQKIFTRRDIAEPEIQCLYQMREHEKIIRAFQPLLAKERPADLGALTAAATLIRLEDRNRNQTAYEIFHAQLCQRFTRRGAMIYNLFRSKILEREIMPDLLEVPENYVANLEKWDTYLMKGYPTAWFVSSNARENELVAELDWRFAESIASVRVFARTEKRNKRVLGQCERYAVAKELRRRTKRYMLGCTPALTVRLFK